MPGFDTLGVRLARSRRRLERERAAVATIEQAAGEGPGGSEQGDARIQVAVSDMKAPISAQVIAFPRSNRRIQN
ncbi:MULTISPECIES: hypothetical protein [unclassified Bosea (in: a-proteobacteria)]|uniref:hypothetical protein n=1 Tax=unclassified Bosea (in: a-proteobacteria) TaxID=2653178 RepID=UPI000F7E7354|nr:MULTISPECIES: hypothetical protein [unclassified Bosea (in: a-proteobacteria)]